MMKTLKEYIIEGKGKYALYIPQVVKSFNDLYAKHKEEIDEHNDEVLKSGKFNDYETRIAYDIASVLKYWNWDFLQDAYDNTIKTLLINALRESDIPYKGKK